MRKEIFRNIFKLFTISWSNILVALSTGIIIFSSIFILSSDSFQYTTLLLLTWVSLGLSVLAGMIIMIFIMAFLNEGSLTLLDTYTLRARQSAFVQLLFFLIGVGLLLILAWANLI